MPTLRLDLDRETYDHLLRQAEAERRPIVWQAEVAIRRALHLPFPADKPEDAEPTSDAAVPR